MDCLSYLIRDLNNQLGPHLRQRRSAGNLLAQKHRSGCRGFSQHQRLHRAIKDLAKKDGYSINQFLITAAAEKLSSLDMLEVDQR